MQNVHYIRATRSPTWHDQQETPTVTLRYHMRYAVTCLLRCYVYHVGQGHGRAGPARDLTRCLRGLSACDSPVTPDCVSKPTAQWYSFTIFAVSSVLEA
jgi:hypothetical protein